MGLAGARSVVVGSVVAEDGVVRVSTVVVVSDGDGGKRHICGPEY